MISIENKYKNIKSRAVRKMKPDFFTFSEAGFGGGQNGWVIGVYQPTPYPKDAWGEEIPVDRINIGLPENTAYKSALPGLFVDGHFPSYIPPIDIDKLKECCPADYEFVKNAMEKEWDFFYCTQPQQWEIIKELSLWYYLDVDDIGGTPALGAMFPTGERSDTPDEEWNARVRYERRREVVCSRRRAQSEVIDEISKSSLIGLSFDWVPSEALNGEKLLRVLYDGQMFYDVQEAVEYAARKAEERQKIEDAERLYKGQVSGNSPIAYFHSPEVGRVYVTLNHGVAMIPRSCFGAAIGKKGVSIRYAQKYFGCHIELKVDIHHKKAWGFHWLDDRPKSFKNEALQEWLEKRL